MDTNEQLSIEEQPEIPGFADACLLLETGDFEPAFRVFSELLERYPENRQIEDGYRTVRFWLNRSSELSSLTDGRAAADFLMNEWELFNSYAKEKITPSARPYCAVEKYIYYTASNHYQTAFQNEENPASSYNLLYNLAVCFVKLSEYPHAVDTLEFARSTFSTDAKILSLLGESYFNLREHPRALLLFREAFFYSPCDIDLSLIRADPVQRLYRIALEEKSGWGDAREWIPVFGHISDIFFSRRHLNGNHISNIMRDIYNLEKNYQSMSTDRIRSTNVLPRLINRYLWLFDYYREQQHDFDNLAEIRSRLLEIDKRLFEPYFKNISL